MSVTADPTFWRWAPPCWRPWWRRRRGRSWRPPRSAARAATRPAARPAARPFSETSLWPRPRRHRLQSATCRRRHSRHQPQPAVTRTLPSHTHTPVHAPVSHVRHRGVDKGHGADGRRRGWLVLPAPILRWYTRRRVRGRPVAAGWGVPGGATVRSVTAGCRLSSVSGDGDGDRLDGGRRHVAPGQDRSGEYEPARCGTEQGSAGTAMLW